MKTKIIKRKIGINVLHVDDSPWITSLLKEKLRSMNNIGRIENASTFESGKAILNKRGIDVAILDIQLPDGNGIELLRWIKERFPRMRVVMFSNYTDAYHRAFSKIAGADYFFDKSIEFEKITGALLEITLINNN